VSRQIVGLIASAISSAEDDFKSRRL